MEALKHYLDTLKVPEQKLRMEEIFDWLHKTFPNLEVEIKWNQPMYMDHGTFIIGFSVAKQHMAFTPEEEGIRVFSDEIKKAGYDHTKGIAKIKWTDEINYDLLKRIIEYNRMDKATCTSFFRK